MAKEPVNGEEFTVTFIAVDQDRINSEAVRELLTPEQLKTVMKTISFEQIKTTRHKGEKPKFQMPNLENATPTGLVDLLGQTREQIKDLEKLEGIYKEALKARLDKKD